MLSPLSDIQHFQISLANLACPTFNRHSKNKSSIVHRASSERSCAWLPWAKVIYMNWGILHWLSYVILKLTTVMIYQICIPSFGYNEKKKCCLAFRYHSAKTVGKLQPLGSWKSHTSNPLFHLAPTSWLWCLAQILS